MYRLRRWVRQFLIQITMWLRWFLIRMDAVVYNYFFNPAWGELIARDYSPTLGTSAIFYPMEAKSFSTASAGMRILEVCGAYNFHNPGSQTPGTIRPQHPYDPVGVASGSPFQIISANLRNLWLKTSPIFPFRFTCF